MVLTGVFPYCWLTLVTFASLCVVVFCFVLLFHHIMSIWLLLLICVGSWPNKAASNDSLGFSLDGQYND